MDAATPVSIPCTADGRLPAAALLLRRLSDAVAAGATTAALERLPYGNGTLPDLLHLAGISRLAFRHPRWPSHWIWEGLGGGKIEVLAPGARPEDAPSLHHGDCPAASDWEAPMADTTTLPVVAGRWRDAAGLLGTGEGADWSALLGLLDGATTTPAIDDRDGPLAAFNPLPYERRCLVDLPLARDVAPWAVRDHWGRVIPAQVVEGATGPRLLCAPRLGALECVAFEPLDEPVAGPLWEVSEAVLDNGRVRAELDARGLIVRLCIDGRFQPLTGPLLLPLLDGLPVDGRWAVSVLERGPVRARVATVADCGKGQIRLVYTVQADAGQIGISAEIDGFSGRSPLLDLPTTWRSGLLRGGGETGGFTTTTGRDLLHGTWHRRGLRWAVLGDGSAYEGLALAARSAIALDAEAGHLRLHLPGPVQFALADAQRARGEPPPWRLAQELACPVGPAGNLPAGGPRLRLVGADDLAPLWLRQLPDGRGEMLLAECAGRRGKAALYPLDRESANAALSDAAGRNLDGLLPTKEADAWVIPYQPYEALWVRW